MLEPWLIYLFSFSNVMDIQMNVPATSEIDCLKLHKMAFIYNAVQSGWEVKLKNGAYLFTKKHEGKKEIYLDKFLRTFVESNLDINSLK